MAVEAETEYRVLARKYRPSSFDDLIGQEPMVRTLSNAFATNRIAQAYMLTGVRGVGKTTTARILARALNYETDTVQQPTLDLSSPGEHCPAIMEGKHVDVIEMDAASHTGIDDIREIIASVRYAPTSARYKVYIIDEVHMLSKQAFNGLLKTLEEPPAHVKFIFATTEIRKVPITVLSRCQRFDLRRIDAGEMTRHLDKIVAMEGLKAQPEALAMIARAGEGSVRDALSLLDQAIAHSTGAAGHKGDATISAEGVRSMLGLADRARVIDLFEHVMKGDIAAALDELKEQYDVGADPATVMTDLAEFVHFVTRVRYVQTALDDPSLSEEEKTRGKDFAQKLSPRVLGRAWQMLLKGIQEIHTSSRPLAAADMVLVRLTHAADLPTPDEAIKKLAEGNGSTAQGGLSVPGSTPSSGNTANARGQISPAGSPGGGTRMKQVANGPMLVVDNHGQPQALDGKETAPAAEVRPSHLTPVPRETLSPDAGPAAPTYETVTSLKDILAIAEKRRDLEFKLMMRNHFSEISFVPPRIEFSITGQPRLGLVHELRSRLLEWTGQPWELIVHEDGGGATLKEQEIATREQHFSDAETDPVVAAIMRTFPKARVVDVRFPKIESEDGLDESAALEAALDNPDEEADDDGAADSGLSNDPGAGSLDDYFNE